MNLDQMYEMMEKSKNEIISKSILTTYHKLNKSNYKKVLCSISGGSDSDIVLDIVSKCDNKKIVDYVFFDTGLEYNATKKHIKELELKYDISIEVIRPKTPIPLACKKQGQPFISKHVSEMISRLQKHEFKWEDEEYDVLIKKYPRCKSAIEWWCNKKPSPSHNINQNKLLKEFLIQNNPSFSISQKCCKYAKKDVLKLKLKEGYDLDISGIRKAEGGARKTAYKSCFDSREDIDRYRPIFWYNNRDKEDYIKTFNIENSDCYKLYGLKRTGCCGCPFGRNYEYELNVLEKYEPKLYKGVINIFNNSYEFTNKYKNFKEGLDG